MILLSKLKKNEKNYSSSNSNRGVAHKVTALVVRLVGLEIGSTEHTAVFVGAVSVAVFCSTVTSKQLAEASDKLLLDATCTDPEFGGPDIWGRSPALSDAKDEQSIGY